MLSFNAVRSGVVMHRTAHCVLGPVMSALDTNHGISTREPADLYAAVGLQMLVCRC
jgi:hypothetical protein